MSFNVISTFSGCGGSSLGYKLAGGKVLIAVEYDKNAIETYKLNFLDTYLFEKDIKTISIDELLEKANLKPYELDIFDGSPPCQGFSMSGKRKFDDNRNSLFKEYVRILNGLKPKCFVMENVDGMVKGNMKFIFVEILKTLKNCDYNVKAKILNAKNFQVPQSRNRLIFIGVRNDLNIEPSFPIGISKIITVKEALKNCPEGERKKPKGKIIQFGNLLKQGENGSKYHSKGSYFSTMRIAYNKTSPTITKQFSTSRAFVFHPEFNESLSIEEVKRIASFPDDFKFIGKFQEKWARIGNCVPPLFMKHIAEHIYENILKKVK